VDGAEDHIVNAVADGVGDELAVLVFGEIYLNNIYESLMRINVVVGNCDTLELH